MSTLQESSFDGYGIEMIREKAPSMIMGFKNLEILDASAGDVIASQTNCRCIWADTGGIVKIDYINTRGWDVTEVVNLVAGVNQFHNVIRLYQYYTGTTAGTAKCYSEAGVEITNAIKLRW